MIRFSYMRHLKSDFFIMSTLRNIRTFVFLDLETTGLPRMENNKTKITELCLVAIEASHIRLGVFPRVQNKLNLCFNPWKLISSESEKITGLSNSILEEQSKFSSNTVNSLNCFFNHNQKPICLVAHNGDNFDYPILRREIEKTDVFLINDVLCIDSLHTFRQLHYEEENTTTESVAPEITSYLTISTNVTDGKFESALPDKVLDVKRLNETTPKKQIVEVFPSIPNPAKKIKLAGSRKNFDISFKLGDVYSRLIKKQPIKEHQAESDVLMLIACAATLGDKFVDWANDNAKKFCDVPSMVPGKKIGT